MAFALALAATTAHQAAAQPALRDGFDGPQISWSDGGGDTAYRIELHERTAQDARSGAGCEFVQLAAATGGTFVHLLHPVQRAPLIAELAPSLWVRSDRGGLQLLARVVLPRAPDEQGQPLTVLIAGTSYARVGSWEQLRIADCTALLARQAWVLRYQSGRDVDTREAYLDRLVINIYGGAGRTRVWIDDLEIAGYVPLDEPPAAMGPRSAGASAGGGARRVELKGSTLLAAGKPLFPRIVQYRGEPLAFLRQRGFNVAWLSTLAGHDLLEEASRAGVWLVCPPPRGLAPHDQQADSAERAAGHHLWQPPDEAAPIGPWFDSVLAWDVGHRLAGPQLDATKRWADQVRRADPQHGRPLVCNAAGDLRLFSRYTSVLLLERYPLATSFELADFATWLRERARLATPGTPIWAVVQTQPSPSLVEQQRLLGATADPAIDSEQIRLLAYAAVAGGAKGICFQSHSRLDADDPATRARAAALELVNRELELVEPWVAAGQIIDEVDSNVPELGGALIGAAGSSLLVPVWKGVGGQYVLGQVAGNSLTYVVPGVPEAHDVYELTPAGLRPVRRHQRVSGGRSVTLDEFGAASLIVFTKDPRLVERLAAQVAQNGMAATALQQALVQSRHEAIRRVDQRLAATSPLRQAPAWLGMAEASLAAASRLQASGNYPEALLEARRAARPLALLARAHWEQSVRAVGSPMTSPLAVDLTTLAEHASFVERARTAVAWHSVLPEGEFESLERMVQAGWQHFQHGPPGVLVAAELSPQTRHAAPESRLSGSPPPAGSSSLRLSVRAVDSRASAGLVETPPAWITSPPLRVVAGQWLRIGGWVYVPEAIRGSLDGLLVFDSMTGEALAERYGQTNGWRQFTLYRAAPHAGPLQLTIALSGYGEAWLDDVTIEVAAPPAAGNPPSHVPVQAVPPSARLFAPP